MEVDSGNGFSSYYKGCAGTIMVLPSLCRDFKRCRSRRTSSPSSCCFESVIDDASILEK